MLANRVFIIHTVLTVLALLWAALIDQPWLSAAFALLWVLAFVVWFEFRNAW